MKNAALVVGIASYPEDTLNNPVNDASDIAEAFTGLGIFAELVTDCGVADFKDSIDEFCDKLKDYDAATFFFAGHGMQFDDENFLCAIDTDFSKPSRAKYSSVSLNYLIDALNRTGVYTKVIVLDACRNNPFDGIPRSISQKGLATVHAPLGTIISFSTSPGETAKDGKGRNGAFTSAFLRYVTTPDLKIEEIFKRTRNTLYSMTSQKQVSWEHTSLMGDFYFSLSTIHGEFQTNYINTALSDSNFDYNIVSPTMELVRNLRSCNWDHQNPVFPRLRKTDFSDANTSELFLLGRNLYQTSCGPSFSAVEYVSALQRNLGFFEDEVRFHILNGMAYEIYFDGQNKLRKNFKVDRKDEVVNVLLDKENVLSARFISDTIGQYDFRVVFDAYKMQNHVFDIHCRKEDDIFVIDGIYLNGLNVMYDYEGISQIEDPRDFYLVEKDRIRDDLARKTATPDSRLVVNYPTEVEDIDEIGLPYDYQVLFHPVKDDSKME